LGNPLAPNSKIFTMAANGSSYATLLEIAMDDLYTAEPWRLL
jgi:hypothetical protein